MSARAQVLVLSSLCMASGCVDTQQAGPSEPALASASTRPQLREGTTPGVEPAPDGPKVIAPPNGPPLPDGAPEEAEPAPETATRSNDLTPPLAEARGPDADLFDRAVEMRRSGDREGARELLLELLKNHPTSPFVPHVYVQLGDDAFERMDMKQALQLFEKALTFPDAGVAAYARYKTGWCHVNLGAQEAALDAFLRASQGAQGLANKFGERLVRSSILDSVLPYASVGKLDRAAVFYTKMTKGTAVTLDEVLRKLATSALMTGREAELRRVCEAAGMPPWCAEPLDQR